MGRDEHTSGHISSSERFTNGWTNPYRYDGRDGARYDASDGLYWLSVRAYDPTLGRFLSRDPLGRAPLFVSDNPYVYAGNNPLSNVDPSGQKVAGANGATASSKQTKQNFARIIQHSGCDKACKALLVLHAEQRAQQLAGAFAQAFKDIARNFLIAVGAFAIIGVGLTFLEQWVFVAIVAGITTALSALSAIAGTIADDFATEGNHGDGWFTKTDLSGFSKSLQATLDREFSPWLLGIEVPTLANMAGFSIAASLLTDIARADKLAGAAQLLLYGALAYEFTLVAGYIYIQQTMESDVAQQEGDVLG